MLLFILIVQIGLVWRVVYGCSEPPGFAEGPFFGYDFPPNGGEISTTSNDNVLFATIRVYDGKSYGPIKDVNVTVNLDTAIVSKYNETTTTTLQLTDPPIPMEDPTGGYQFDVVTEGSTLIAQLTNLTSESMKNINLVPGDGYELKAIDNYYHPYFFVSNSLQKIYIFYEIELDCSSTSIQDDQCNTCPTCIFSKSRVAIVDDDNTGSTGDVTATTIFTNLDGYGSGLYVDNAGPSYSLSNVYDSIHIAPFGPMDSCGGIQYLYYTSSTVQMLPDFEVGYLYALQYGDGTLEDLRLFDMYQEKTFEEETTSTGEIEYKRWVSQYIIREKFVITGELIREIVLNKDNINDVVNNDNDLTTSECLFPSLNICECFSGSNTIEVLGRGMIRMDELQIGDNVRTMNGMFTRVYSFLHLDRKSEANYLQIQLNDDGKNNNDIPAFEISNEHMVYLADGSIVRAIDLHVGDVFASGQTIEEIVPNVKRIGMYAPATMSGDILVSGVSASNYVTYLSYLPPKLQHYAAHTYFFPRRILCILKDNCQNDDYETYNINGIPDHIIGIVNVFSYIVSTFPISVQIGLLLLVTPLLVFLHILEKLIMLNTGIYFVAITLSSFVIWKATRYDAKKGN